MKKPTELVSPESETIFKPKVADDEVMVRDQQAVTRVLIDVRDVTNTVVTSDGQLDIQEKETHAVASLSADERKLYENLHNVRLIGRETQCPEKQRPLGVFSDFVVNDLGIWNEKISNGERSGDDLSNHTEAMLSAISDDVTDGVKSDVSSRRMAILDLVFVGRSLEVALKGNQVDTRLFQLTKYLADIEKRYPCLQWSETAKYFPISDPRTFFSPGSIRDQELLLYGTQKNIELIFEYISHCGGKSDPDCASLHALPLLLEKVLDAMIHLNKSRDKQHFKLVDPFLGPSPFFPAFPSGSFSAWTYLAGYRLAGNMTFKGKLLDPRNRPCFDRDADQYIDEISSGGFQTIQEIVDGSNLPESDKAKAAESLGRSRQLMTQFLYAHRGAVKIHANATLAMPAPSKPEINNDQSFSSGIVDMGDHKPVKSFFLPHPNPSSP